MTNALTGALPARRGSRVPKSWQSKFIATLSETSNVAAAARAAKVSTSRVYQSPRESPEFAQLWFAALCDGYDALEMDLLYRLRTGKVEETDENGTKRKFDSATAFKCLLAHRETVSREKARQGTDDESAILASINAKIEAMRQRDRDREPFGHLTPQPVVTRQAERHLQHPLMNLLPARLKRLTLRHNSKNTP